MTMEIVNTLEHLTISSFCQCSRAPIRLETGSIVREALKTFNNQKILSCPIANSAQGADVHGFLDLFDLLAYLLELWEANENGETNGVTKLGEQFLNHTVRDLIDRSDNDVYAAVIGSEQADRLVRLFGLGVHRVALLDIRGNLNNIVSQSDVARYLSANLQLFGEFANKTIKELNMISSDKLIVADSEQTAISAFKLIATNLVSAVPIVDKNGVLTGTLSVSDLKLLQDDLSPLLLSTKQYKALQEPTPNIVCTNDSTLGEVLSLLASSNVHRVWVVENNNNNNNNNNNSDNNNSNNKNNQKLVSVISITTICEYLCKFIPEEDD